MSHYCDYLNGNFTSLQVTHFTIVMFPVYALKISIESPRQDHFGGGGKLKLMSFWHRLNELSDEFQG